MFLFTGLINHPKTGPPVSQHALPDSLTWNQTSLQLLHCAKTVASLCVRAPGRKRTTSCAERHPRTTASWKWRPAPLTQTLSARTAWAHLPSASRDHSSPVLIQTLPRGYYEKPAAPGVQKVQKRGRESSSSEHQNRLQSGNDSTQNIELIQKLNAFKGNYDTTHVVQSSRDWIHCRSCSQRIRSNATGPYWSETSECSPCPNCVVEIPSVIVYPVLGDFWYLCLSLISDWSSFCFVFILLQFFQIWTLYDIFSRLKCRL